MGTDIHGVFQKKTKSGWEDVASEHKYDRHYLLFAWLGNVRNGFGFAGVSTHTAIVPLSDRRGFPADFNVVDEEHPAPVEAISREWEKERGSVWMGDHSHSWLNADEVLAAELPTILRTGIVSAAFFKSWDGKSAPDSWSGGISGQGVVVSSPDEVSNKTTHVRIEWFEDTNDSLDYFVAEVKRLKDLHGEVRFVFGFDS